MATKAVSRLYRIVIFLHSAVFKRSAADDGLTASENYKLINKRFLFAETDRLQMFGELN